MHQLNKHISHILKYVETVVLSIEVRESHRYRKGTTVVIVVWWHLLVEATVRAEVNWGRSSQPLRTSEAFVLSRCTIFDVRSANNATKVAPMLDSSIVPLSKSIYERQSGLYVLIAYSVSHQSSQMLHREKQFC